MKSLSVVIPLYNKSAFVRSTVESFLAQLDDGDEVIVVDDASTDGGIATLRDLSSDRLLLITSNTNKGPATIRNMGADHARNEFLLFFDADDLPHCGLVAALKAAIVKHPDESIFAYDICIEARGEVMTFDREDALNNVRALVLPKDAYAQSCLAGRHLCTASSTCVRASVFRTAGGFQDGLRSSEDPELWARLSARHGIVHIPMSLAFYRDIAGSLSYVMRGRPGAVQPYVHTLLALSRTPTDVYHRLAQSVIVKNSIFSLANGESSRIELRRYLDQSRAPLGFMRWATLQLLSYTPSVVPKLGFAIRDQLRWLKAVAKSALNCRAQSRTRP